MGWGAILGHLTVGDVWNCYRHIGDRVTEAIGLGLQHFAPVLKGGHVPVWTDSMTAKAVINRQGDLRSTFEMRFARRIGRWSSQNVMSLTAGHIPGNNNVATDTLSGGGTVRRRMEPRPNHSRHDRRKVQESSDGSLLHDGASTSAPCGVKIPTELAPLGTNAFGPDPWPRKPLHAFPLPHPVARRYSTVREGRGQF